MTYPPQPGPYGQQPGPYGGQSGGPQQGGSQQGGYPQPGGPPPSAPQPGGVPQSGGFPQQGMQQGGYPPQGQPPGFPQGPSGVDQQPTRKKTGLIAGIAAAVLVIAAVLVTGFWAPGFFVGDDTETSAEGGDSGGGASDDGGRGSGDDAGTGGQDGGFGDSGDSGGTDSGGLDSGGLDGGGLDSGSAGAQSTAAEYASALSDLDVPRMKQLVCAGATDAAPEGEAPEGFEIQASVTHVEQTSADKATAKLDMQVSSGEQSGSMKADMTLENQGGWCVSGFNPSGGGSTGF